MEQAPDSSKAIQPVHWAILAFSTLIFIGLRIPLLGQSICDSDIAGIVYSGWGIVDGRLPFRDIFETKPPGTYFLFAAVIRIFGIDMVPLHVLGIFWGIGALFALFLITRKLVNTNAGVIAAAVYSIASAHGYINGICPNYETWAVTPGLFGLYAYLFAIKGPREKLWALVSGFLLGMSMSMKFQGLFFILVVAIAFVFVARPWRPDRIVRFITIGSIMAGGFFAYWAIFVLYYAGHGALPYLLEAISPKQGASYAQATSTVFLSESFLSNIKNFIVQMPILWACLIVAIIAGIAGWRNQPDRKSAVGFLFLWWALTLFACFFLKGLLADGHFYPHYLVLAVPAFCALFGFAGNFFIERLKTNKWIATAIIAVAIIFIAIGQRTEFAFAKATLSSLVRTGEVADSEIISEFRELEFVYGMDISRELMRVAKYVEANSDPETSFFVWDPLTSAYIFAKRKSPTYYYKPYFSSTTLPWSVHKEGDLELDEIRNRIMKELEQDPPKFVLLMNNTSPAFPDKEPLFEELKWFLEKTYVRDLQISDETFTLLTLKSPEDEFEETSEPLN